MFSRILNTRLGCFRSSRMKLFCKKVLLKISLSSQESLCVRVSFLVKLKVSSAYNFIKKESLVLVFSCEFCKILKSTFFIEHLRWLLLLLLISLCLLNNGWCHSTSSASSYVEDTFKFNATIFSLLFFLFSLWWFSICVFTNNSLLFFDSPKAGSLLSAVKCTLYVLDDKERDRQEIL